jgi:hypothetical protein
MCERLRTTLLHSFVPAVRDSTAKIAPWLLGVAGVAALVWLVHRGWLSTDNPHADFYDFYWAADAARRGTDIYASGDGGYVYPPLLATLLMPITLMDPQHAMQVWILACAAGLAWCAWHSAAIARRAAGCPKNAAGTIAIAGMALLVLADSFRSEFQWANCNVVMLVAIVLALRVVARHPVLAGGLLAIACFVKYLPIGFLAYFAIRRQWRAMAGMACGLLACALAPALWLGWSENLDGLARAARGMGVMSGAVQHEHAAKIIPIDAPYSLSITSGIARMLGPQRAALQFAGVVGLAAVAALGAGYFVYRVHGRQLFARGVATVWAHVGVVTVAEWSCVLAGALAFSPQTQKRHFNLLVPLVALLIALAVRTTGAMRRWAIAAMLILAVGVTPMPNIPGTRGFNDGTWKWMGGPGWMVVLMCLVLMHVALRTDRHHE